MACTRFHRRVDLTLTPVQQAYFFTEPGMEPGVSGGFTPPGGVWAGLPKFVCVGWTAAGPSAICQIARFVACSKGQSTFEVKAAYLL